VSDLPVTLLATVPDTATWPRVVFHPEVPARHRRLLTAHPEELSQVRPVPAAPSWRRGLQWLGRHQPPLWVGLLAVMTFLTGQATSELITMLRSRPELAALAPAAPMREATLVLALGMLATSALWLLIAAATDHAVRRTARLHRHRTVAPTDLDNPAREMLYRAQAAIAAVLSSQVYDNGMVDRPRAAVTLAGEEWEIAVALRAHARLRATQRQAEQAASTERAGKTVRLYHHMLDTATCSLTARVEELERYAEQVQAADTAYAEQHALRVLADERDQYEEVLARAAVDARAWVHVRELALQAQHVAQAMRRPASSFNPAIRTGHGRLLGDRSVHLRQDHRSTQESDDKS
jgi:hypothetical protein